jgi:hypothetical protein
MAYGTNNYGSEEYAGRLGGTATVPSIATEKFIFAVCTEDRGVKPGREEDPIVPFEDRGVKAMPSATMEIETKVKDPDAVKDFHVDWADVLDTAETIATAAWDGGGLTPSGGYILGDKSYTLLAGGVTGTTYVVTNTIVTSAGRTYNRQFRIACQET